MAEPSAPATASPQSLPATPAPNDATKGQAIDPKAAPAQEAPRKIKVKTNIDGVEQFEELTEEELSRHYQLSKASSKRFEEGAAMRKQGQEVIDLFKDPQKLVNGLSKLGYSDEQIQTLAEEFLYGRLKLAQMTPEQKELFELKNWRQRKEIEEKQAKANQEKQANDAKITQLRGAIEKDVIFALENSAVPPTPQNVWRMADKLRVNLQRGINVNAKEAAEMVYQDLIREYRHLATKLTPDKFAEVLGEDALNMIRKHDLEKVKQAFPENRVKREKKEPFFVKKKKGYTTESDFKKYLEAKKAQPN